MHSSIEAAALPPPLQGPLAEIERYVRLERELAADRAAVLDHPMYRRVQDTTSLRVFMTCHAFAVWDFMSLLKSLQRRLTCVDVPWLPPADPTFARLINEIVLGEETDEVSPGRYISHFELYLAAMVEVGADTRPVACLVSALRAGEPLERVLERIPVPEAVRQFVVGTLSIARSGSIHEVAAAFLLGREDLVPSMFRRLLVALEADVGHACPSFRLYLERHVELDEHEHGPRARRILQGLCADDASAWEQALAAARIALCSRKRLWDAVIEQMISTGAEA